ncbi:hypothetical protein BH09BAC5_BH09BAC5_08430 [soil metagenome]
MTTIAKESNASLTFEFPNAGKFREVNLDSMLPVSSIFNFRVTSPDRLPNKIRERKIMTSSHISASPIFEIINETEVEEDIIHAIIVNQATQSSSVGLFLSKLLSLDEIGEKHNTIKFIFSFFEKNLEGGKIGIVDSVLKSSLNFSFSFSSLLAMLTSTVSFKEQLINRSALFDKTRRIGADTIGIEKLEKSIFLKLK